MSKVTFTVNGKTAVVDVEPRTLLADALRDELGLTGTHIGCDTSQCGCCTIRMDGSAVKSCTLLAVQAEGASIETIEGLAKPKSAASAPAEPAGVLCRCTGYVNIESAVKEAAAKMRSERVASGGKPAQDSASQGGR